MTNRKSSSHKVIAVGAGEGPHAGVPLPNERHVENVEALIPMISGHFLDTKVSQTKHAWVCEFHRYMFYVHKSRGA